MNKLLIRIVVCAIPVFILLGMSTPYTLTLTIGKEVRIQTAPVDPRDIFRGDHVILDFEISTIPISKVQQSVIQTYEEQNEQIPVYVIIEADQTGIYRSKQVVTEQPNEGIYIKGKLEYMTETGNSDAPDEPAQEVAIINYHLDRYFVPENTGHSLEEAAQNGTAVATIKLRNGHAVLTKVEIP